VVIGSSPPLAYCIIFIIMFSEVVDLHNCIYIRTSHYLYLCMGWVLQLHCRGLLCCHQPRFPSALTVFTCLLSYGEKSCDCCCMVRSHVIAVVWREVMWLLPCSNSGCDFSTLSSQMLLNKDRQCWESWRDAELGVLVVCGVGDTTGEDHWVDLLCYSPHCDTAENCVMNDMLTTFSLSAAQRLLLAANYIFLVTFSVL